MSFVKYRVKEVAADFGVAPKVIAEIVGQFFEKPKSNTQVLSEEELNVVFDYMTQKNQVKSMEEIFAVKPAAPKEEPKQEAKAAPAQRPQQTQQPKQGQNLPQQPQNTQPAMLAPMAETPK